MGRSSILLQVVRAGQKAARDAERARLADSRARERYQARLQAQTSRDAKRAFIEGMEAQAESMTEDWQQQLAEIDAILEASLETEHLFDLETLRQYAVHPEFESLHSEPEDAPLLKSLPERPTAKEHMAFRLIGWALPRSSREKLVASTQGKFRDDEEIWKSKVAELESHNNLRLKQWKSREANRLKQLSKAQEAYNSACLSRENEIQFANAELDSLIENLPRGKKHAVETYTAMVLGESQYPEGLEPEYELSFDELSRELSIQLELREPEAITDVSSFRFQKSSGEMIEKKQTQKEHRSRYEGYVGSSTLRTIHEVLEADRHGVIRHVSVIVFVDHLSASTGKPTRTKLLGVTVERDSFLELDLSSVVVMDTLTHLKAAISKNMVNLTPIQSAKSIRKA
jgi:restriction system protein